MNLLLNEFFLYWINYKKATPKLDSNGKVYIKSFYNKIIFYLTYIIFIMIGYV